MSIQSAIEVKITITVDNERVKHQEQDISGQEFARPKFVVKVNINQGTKTVQCNQSVDATKKQQRIPLNQITKDFDELHVVMRQFLQAVEKHKIHIDQTATKNQNKKSRFKFWITFEKQMGSKDNDDQKFDDSDEKRDQINNEHRRFQNIRNCRQSSQILRHRNCAIGIH